MSYYRHTQVGTVLLVTMTIVVLISIVVVREVGPNPGGDVRRPSSEEVHR